MYYRAIMGFLSIKTHQQANQLLIYIQSLASVTV